VVDAPVGAATAPAGGGAAWNSFMNRRTARVSGTERIAPAGPSTHPQNTRERMIARKLISRPVAIIRGFTMLSTTKLITVYATITVAARPQPIVTIAITAGGSQERMIPTCGTKLKKNASTPQIGAYGTRSANSTPVMITENSRPVAAVIRTIDALKTFDTIYVITGGGPGTASETINLYLYLQAFAFYNIGTASAVVVVFFVIVLALALLLLHVREKTRWS